MTHALNAFSTRTAAARRGVRCAGSRACRARDLVGHGGRASHRATARQTGAGPHAGPRPGRRPGRWRSGPATSAAARSKPASSTASRRRGRSRSAAIDFRGGGAYDSDSALRWRITGTDLGLQTRRLAAEVGVQGKFRLTLGYDSLLRNSSDSYQTPYHRRRHEHADAAGDVAGAGRGVEQRPRTTDTTSVSARGLDPAIGAAPYLDTQTTSPTRGHADRAERDAARARQRRRRRRPSAVPSRQPVHEADDATTPRSASDLTPAWVVDVGVRAEHKDGMKPMGTVSRNTGGDICDHHSRPHRHRHVAGDLELSLRAATAARSRAATTGRSSRTT